MVECVRRLALASSIAFAALIALPPPASASCAFVTKQQQLTQADVVFDGVALGDRADAGVLLSPVRFQVARYLKGSGPGVTAVKTGVRERMSTSISIRPVAGEAWRIYAYRSSGGKLDTSLCTGSARLRGDRAKQVRQASGDAPPQPRPSKSSIAPAVAIPVLGLLLVGGFGAWRLVRPRPR